MKSGRTGVVFLKKIDMEVKQVIVMRKDLSMRKGKMVSQGAHASLGALLKVFAKFNYDVDGKEGIDQVGETVGSIYMANIRKDSILDKWLNGIFTKICLGVNSEEEIHEMAEQCAEANIPYAVITDNGLTEFHGVPTVTCIGIGPYWSEEIDKITGGLSLL